MHNDEIIKILKVHRSNDQLDFRAIWEEGLFVFDANVLLDLYRLPQSASKDLMKVLNNDTFKKRIWTGFQVILEFSQNRLDAISDQKSKFSSVGNLIEDAISSHAEVTKKLLLELSKLKLKKRHSVIDPDTYLTPERISESTSYLSQFLAELKRLDAGQADVHDHDPIKDFVFSAFEGRIGKSLDQKTLDELYKDGDKRYSASIPPGFKDIKKEGVYVFDGKRYIRKFGDLIFWREIVEKASADKLKYVVLVTGDVKEDWWSESRGKRLGPRSELLDEIYACAPSVDTFHMYDTSSFLQYAKTYLDKNIKASSISEASDLIALNRSERGSLEQEFLSIADSLRASSSGFEKLQVGIGQSVEELPLLRLQGIVLYQVMMELFSNVAHHCPDQYVSVHAMEERDVVRLRFKNRKPENRKAPTQVFMTSNPMSHRGGGLEHIRHSLARVGIDTHVSDTGNKFMVDLFIPREFFVQQSSLS